MLDSIAGDEGTWGAEALPTAWVRVIAEISVERIIEVWQRLLVIIEQEHGYDEDWQSPAVVQSLFDLNSLCRLARTNEEDVVHVWNL